MEIGHKIDSRLRYCVSDFVLAGKQQMSIENINSAGMAISGCAAITGVYVFCRAGSEIVTKNLCV